MKKDELRYLQRLAEIYPTIGKASTENYQSSVNPESAEGNGTLYVRPSWEYQAFSHVLRNGSGAVREED